MASLIRRFVQEKPLDFDVDDEFNVEYSFAMEYKGPAVSYSIPRIDPVNVDHIPVAARVSRHEVGKNLSLPVLKPIVKIDSSEKRLSKLELEQDVSLIPVTHSNELEVARVLDVSKSRRTAFRVVNVIDTSGELEFSESDECIPRLLKEYGSSGTLGFSDSHDISRDLSESSDTECLQEDYNDSGASSTGYELDVGKSNVKKGSCHRCFVKKRFMEKEACIVCNAKYCSNCVIRAMGSMPEGRKCSTCIGRRIDESKRARLGKSSRMLRRLLTELGAKQIMSHEVSCEVNQVSPELVILNGKPLCREELVQLLGCPNPPRKLKPRKYWYDKQSGLWGLEGEKPCQIITPQLDVGDPIMQNASNGNTNILVNNREITKPELWVMQLAGIHCEGQPHYWCSADGSFQEVGQKNVIERIWFKPKVKLLCSVLSLPTPLEPASSGQEEARRVGIEGVPSKLEQKTSYKLLMVGYDKSGTSTIFKQAKFLYKVPFSEDERQNLKHMIQSNLYRYIGILLEERERFEVEAINEMRIKSINQPDPSDALNSDQIEKTNMYSISRRLHAFSDWLLQVMMSGNLEAVFPASTREYAPLVEELWKDRAFQATFDRRNEIQILPRVANYFLNRAVEISRTDYEPSDMDILYAEGISSSNSIASVEFSFPKSMNDSFLDPSHQDDPSQRYQLVRIHSSSLGKKCKWLEMFEDMDLIIYCVSLTDYDEYSYDINGISTNKMMESKKLFESIVTHPVCNQKNFLLILNKFDLLEEKIEQVPLTQCEWFHDFNPVQSSSNSNSSTSRNPIAPLAQRAFHYIAAKFKRQFKALTGNKLYVSRVTGLESDSVDEALKYGTEVLKWDYEKPSFNINDWTDSIETSTFS